MEIQDLMSRVRVLQQELGNHKQSVNALTEQLEQAKVQFHMTNGRIQELAHLVDMEQKIQKDKAEAEAAKLAAEEAAKKAAEEEASKAVMD